MSGTAKFSLEVGPIGFRNIIVNGTDVSDQVQAVELQSRLGQASLLVLYEVGTTGPIQGEGVIRVVPEASFNPQEMVKFLSAIDPRALEAEILNRSDFGDSTMAVALEVLKEWAGGNAST